MEKEPYNQRDHSHCWNQKVSACGIDKVSHKVCCLCEKPMENKETNEIKGLPRLANPTPEVIEEIMAPVKELREIMKETNEKCCDNGFLGKKHQCQKSSEETVTK